VYIYIYIYITVINVTYIYIYIYIYIHLNNEIKNNKRNKTWRKNEKENLSVGVVLDII
jgi:hypothetical protein